jgi:hypothetical protein
MVACSILGKIRTEVIEQAFFALSKLVADSAPSRTSIPCQHCQRFLGGRKIFYLF